MMIGGRRAQRQRSGGSIDEAEDVHGLASPGGAALGAGGLGRGAIGIRRRLADEAFLAQGLARSGRIGRGGCCSRAGA